MIRSVLFALAVVVVATEDVVVTLEGEEAFDTWIGEQAITVVEFYAPWCGHCKKLLPEFEKAAEELASEDIKLGKVDCTTDDNKDLCQRFGVSGYPTIKWFRDSEAADYRGGRSSADILGFVRARAGPPVTELSADNAESFVKRSPLVMIEFAEKVSEEFEKSAASLLEKISFGSVSDEAVAKTLGAEFPSVTLFRNFDEPILKFDGEVGSAEFNEWVTAESLPVLGEIGPGNYQTYMDRGLPLAWIAVTPGGEHDELLQELKPVAADHRGKLSVVSIDGVKFDGHLKKLGLTGDLPGVILTHGNLKYRHEKELNKDNLAEFLSGYLDGTLEAYMKSEEPPEDNSGPVKVVVGKTFSEFTAGEKDVLLEFYAPWCGHCKKLAPIYEELGEYFADEENLVIAKMDATENDTDQEIRGFPTIMLFSPKFDEPLTYKGERTLEGFQKFLKKHSPALKGASSSHDEL